MEAFGSVFSTGTLEGSDGLTSMCPSKVSFLNVHPREKPFQTLGHKKTILFFCFFVFCCQKKLLFIKAYSWKLLGQSFLQVLLRDVTV